MARHPLTGITREIAEAISACVRNVHGSEMRDATVGEMAEAVAAIPVISAADDLLQAVRDARQNLEDLAEQISNRTWRAEEKGEPNAWDDMDEPLRDGTFASMFQQFDAAIAKAVQP